MSKSLQLVVNDGVMNWDGVGLGFHGADKTPQRAGAAGAAVTATTITGAAGANPTQAEYAVVVARLNAAIILVNEMRATLVEKGLHKGSA